MSLTHRIALGAAFLALPTLTGCGGGVQAGGQTGEESSDGCVFVLTPLSAQELSPLGFSAEQVLALAKGEKLATFDWLETPGVTYGPESGAGQVTVDVSASGPAQFARFQESKRGAQCHDHVEIPVNVALSTAGGALDESFTTTLVATSADEAAVTQVVPAAELRGTFAFSPDTLGARRFLRLEVNLRFGAEAFAGYLFGSLESGDAASGVTSFQPVPLACWGEIPSLASSCAN
ncbi:MAG TPA: hypothetical protein VER04_07675 [Polyangiaceae bacterium]|nr:hypothetical protein [Polyangiaceae bacterium]